MKKEISKYSDLAKTLLGAIAMFLVTGGFYDEATAQLLVGAAMAVGTGFWQLYDLATTKRLEKTVKPVAGFSSNSLCQLGGIKQHKKASNNLGLMQLNF